MNDRELHEIKRIDPGSAAEVGAGIGLLAGLVCGVLYAFGGLIIDLATIRLSFGTILAFGALFAMPVIIALAGGALGGLLAYAYNLIAGLTGGVKVELGGKN